MTTIQILLAITLAIGIVGMVVWVKSD
jgi:hypothetical protein